MNAINGISVNRGTDSYECLACGSIVTGASSRPQCDECGIAMRCRGLPNE